VEPVYFAKECFPGEGTKHRSDRRFFFSRFLMRQDPTQHHHRPRESQKDIPNTVDKRETRVEDERDAGPREKRERQQETAGERKTTKSHTKQSRREKDKDTLNKAEERKTKTH
jgi:hypothetical protein